MDRGWSISNTGSRISRIADMEPVCKSWDVGEKSEAEEEERQRQLPTTTTDDAAAAGVRV